MKKVLNNKINDNYKYVSLVLGSGESALGIVRSLSADKKIKIILIGKDNLANNSRYIHEFFKVNTYDEAELDQYFNKIIFNYKNLIIYPSGNDFWVNYLLKKKKLLKNKKIVENANLVKLMNKNYQFDLCSRLNIPHPKSIKIKKTNQINQIKKLNLPLIIKPEERNTLKEDFRNIFIGFT